VIAISDRRVLADKNLAADPDVRHRGDHRVAPDEDVVANVQRASGGNGEVAPGAEKDVAAET
jgi:hypothetical protein